MFRVVRLLPTALEAGESGSSVNCPVTTVVVSGLSCLAACPMFLSPSPSILFRLRSEKVDITGGPKQIVAARHAIQDKVAEWKTSNNPNGDPEETEYSLKVKNNRFQSTSEYPTRA